MKATEWDKKYIRPAYLALFVGTGLKPTADQKSYLVALAKVIQFQRGQCPEWVAEDCGAILIEMATEQGVPTDDPRALGRALSLDLMALEQAWHIA